MSSSHQPIHVFISRLQAISDLPSDVAHALESVVANVRTYAADQDIVCQGDRPSQVCVLLDGWIGRNKVVLGGKRQITALHFAGVIPDLQSLFTPVMDHNITALTTARVAFIPHTSLRELMNRYPALAQAFWQETLIEAAISREWEVNLGSRPAAERIAHIFCEIGTRLERFGRAIREDDALSFALPLNQSQLAEATGISTVHVNRSLQTLRGSGLVEVTRERTTILERSKLEAFAGFNPDYLLAEAPRAHA